MPGPEFFQTPMGHKFYEGTMPAIAKNLTELSKSLACLPSISEALDKISESLAKLANPVFAVDVDDCGHPSMIRLLRPGESAKYMAPLDKLNELIASICQKDMVPYHASVGASPDRKSAAEIVREAERLNTQLSLEVEAIMEGTNAAAKSMLQDALDIMVHDLASNNASATNNQGYSAQVTFILSELGPKEGAEAIRDMIKGAREV